MRRRIFPILFALSLVGAVAHLAWAAGQLPDQVASHFDGAGHPDGHSTRTTFLAIYGLVVLMLAVTFGGFGVLIPRLPDSVVNIPHREYWLAPARRQATMARLSDQMALMGALTVGFIVATMHLVVQANRPGQAGLPQMFWPLFIGYMLATVAWVVWLVVAFRRPEPGAR